MIIVQLIGGLGNQLFQYAAGRQAAVDRKTELLLDTRWFKTQTLRSYLLNEYPISAKVANTFDLEPFTQTYPGRIWRWILKVTRRSTPDIKYKIVSEFSPGYHSELLQQPGHIYMQGYFQNERYFSRIGDEIRNTLNPIREPDAQNRKYLELIDNSQSISVHVRRGDYIENPIQRQFHGVCGLEYYTQAIELIAKKVTKPNFYIFSDDPDWAESNLDMPFTKVILRNNDANQATEDLRLMSRCKHHIIANSSFSWWGAWLGTFPHKIIIAPQKWFNDVSINTKDLIPESWIRM